MMFHITRNLAITIFRIIIL